ncbi:neuropeptide-like 4 [Anoplophora glabripennis]|uniref:neuropeptide-like 4 n=1 Tax=Anoplophora glabripennis TaxID=217634 RepID=UPI00087438A3|nr:neuropeptide-like 4 [Anoplophora glabripennis]
MFKYLVFFALLAVAFAVASADPAPAPKPLVYSSYGAVPLAYSAPYYSSGYYGGVVY